MSRVTVSAAALGACALLVSGCGSKQEAQAPTPEAPAGSVAKPADAQSGGPVASARQSLDAGKFDEAAARLLEARASGKEMTQQEAANYRETLEEAYARALEAAQKGDPRAQATLQMIKAATAR